MTVLRDDIVPEIEILEEFETQEPLDEAETFWYDYFRMIGCRLTNLVRPGSSLDTIERAKLSMKISEYHHRRDGLSSEERAVRSIERWKQIVTWRRESNRRCPARQQHGNVGSKRTETEKQNLREKSVTAIAVIMTKRDETGVVIEQREFSSQKSAALFYGMKTSQVQRVVDGTRKNVKGMEFKKR